MGDKLFEVVIIFVLLVVNGIFAMTEIAVVSSRKARLKQMADQGKPGADSALQLSESPNQFLATVQIGITLVGIFAGAFGGATIAEAIGVQLQAVSALAPYGDSIGLAIVVLCITFFSLVIGELVPKRIALGNPEIIASRVARPMMLLAKISSPAVKILSIATDALLHILPFKPTEESAGTVDEIATLANMARHYNLIGHHEESIIKNATKMSITKVDNVMIPHDQITFLSTAQTMTDAVLTAHFDPHTRFPICEDGDRNHVLGYINFKELVYRARTNPSDPSLRGIVRPVHFVHRDESAADLLRMFVEQHVHMAIVRDDEDKTLGLVTMEDLVEELVGELEDEFDRLPRMCHALSGGTWMVGGGFPASKLNDVLGVSFEYARGSTSAWLIERMGRVPKVNEVYVESNYEFLIRRTRRGKIFEVSVSKPRPSAVR